MLSSGKSPGTRCHTSTSNLYTSPVMCLEDDCTTTRIPSLPASSSRSDVEVD